MHETIATWPMSLLAPARRLPAELWGEIFLFSIPLAYWDFYMHAYRRAVMLPGSVCTQWRKIALSTPRLWARIALDVEDGYEDVESALASTWLTRSGGCPLRIKLTVYRHVLTPGRASIVDIIVAHCHRWAYIALSIPSAMSYGLAFAKHRSPQLWYLSIEHPNDPTPWTMALEAFEVAPRLRHLFIGHQVSPFLLRIPWSQLESIFVDSGTFRSEECLEILRLSSNLYELQVRTLTDIAVPPIRPIVQTELVRLDLSIHSDPAWLWDHLTLPSLCDLYYYEEGGHWAQPQFISFLCRSSCSLKLLVLAFSLASMSEGDLINILRLTPALEILELQHHASYALTSAVLGQLTRQVSEDGDVICLAPKLRFISIQWHDDLDELALTDMIESRWTVCHRGGISSGASMPGISQIESVILEERDQSSRQLDLVALARMHQFACEGLDVCIETVEDDDD